MRKLGPILAIISGTFTLVFAILGLLVAQAVITGFDFMGDYTSDIAKNANDANTSVSAVYGVMIAIGALQVLFGVYAFKNGKGFAAFVLLVLFAATTTLAIIAGVKSNNWPASSIITIVINGLAATGLLIGFTSK